MFVDSNKICSSSHCLFLHKISEGEAVHNNIWVKIGGGVEFHLHLRSNGVGFIVGVWSNHSNEWIRPCVQLAVACVSHRFPPPASHKIQSALWTHKAQAFLPRPPTIHCYSTCLPTVGGHWDLCLRHILETTLILPGKTCPRNTSEKEEREREKIIEDSLNTVRKT